ncbi:MAG: type II toxin-antitoxin system HicA family toxin [Betaproteobacteria bacterium]|nr:type II toxin-antitoxin system HicA family toxin [Betaproteobacteria bacterium]
MTTFPAVTGKGLLSALAKAGFIVVRVKGSHHFLRNANGRTTVVPFHAGETIGPGLLSKILRDCELSREDTLRLL